MSKIAFMFPGQGSFEAGMGKDVAEAVPEAMAVYDEGSRVLGHGSEGALLRRRRWRRWSRPRCSSRRSSRRRSRSTRRCARAGISPDFVVGHSVGEFAALGSARSISVRDAIALVRERGIAMAAAAKEHPGSMAAILGLADEAVENLCHKIAGVWPANYNCPGQLVISGETPSVDEACAEAEREGARRAVRLRVSGAFHSPLVARAGDVLRPAIEKVHLSEGRSAFMSTVTAKLEDAQRYRELLIEQLTAPVKFTQSARELINNGVTTFVEVGPGNVLSGLLKRIDRSVRVLSVRDLESLDAATKALG